MNVKKERYNYFSFRWPSSKSTTSTEATETTKTIATTTSSPTKPKTSILVQDISAFLPPGYKLKKEDTVTTESSSLLSDILARSKVDISSLLPPDYNKKKNEEASQPKSSTTTVTTTASTTTAAVSTTTAKSTGVVSPEKISIQSLFASSKVDITALLPKDYEQRKKNFVPDSKPDNNASSEQNTTTVNTDVDSVESPTTTKKPPGLKVVFPSRPGGRKPGVHKITTPHTPREDGPGAVTPKIQKGWPTR